MNRSVVIPSGILKACIQLEATDDNIVEGTKYLTLMAELNSPSDVINGTTSVIIYDNDGKNCSSKSTSIYRIIIWLAVL